MSPITDERPEVPPPGSGDALSRGCRCAIFDNRYGLGYRTAPDGKPEYWITMGCPVHSPTPIQEERAP